MPRTAFRKIINAGVSLTATVAFVSYVMGIPIPGLSQLGIQQPSTPFQP